MCNRTPPPARVDDLVIRYSEAKQIDDDAPDTTRHVTHDSGARVEYPSGMVRDTTDGKPRYDLIPHGPLRRLAELYARGGVKYGDDNWTLANTPEELARFRASAYRHFAAWAAGTDDGEDHGIAAVWNIFAALHTADTIDQLATHPSNPQPTTQEYL